MFDEIPKYLGKAGLTRDRDLARIVVEKPIGVFAVQVMDLF